MNKDVIYIDVEDDITAIIGKVKDSKEKVVALVPPKRTGVLQSAVNLRILQRTAKSSSKHIVLITHDQSLIPLAAGAGMPVAKNLQSKPEIPEIAALKVDDDDDIIDGSQLPVGEHAATASAVAAIEAEEKSDDTGKKPYASPPKSGESPRKPKAAGKVPDFGKFRKKMLLIGLGGVLLIVFLIWAIFFAPHATVEITAKTSSQNLSTSVTVGTGVQTDAAKGTLKSTQVQDVVQSNVDVQATGTQEQGEAATGTLTLSKGTPDDATVPVGTGFSSGDCTFVTREQVTVPGATPKWNGSGFAVIAGTKTVSVKATAIGEQCNLSARSYDSTVSGISAKGGDMSGGSKKTLKIVTQADVQKASEQIAEQNGTDTKTKLAAKFAKNVKSIDSSFRTLKADTNVSPQVGQEAPNGTAKLTSSITYVMDGVSTSELDSFIKSATEAKLSDEDNQRVYDSGASSAQLTKFTATDNGGTVTLTATAKVGPQISDEDVKKRSAGKKAGAVQDDLKSIQGVQDVEVHLWPFWVGKVPSDTNKIDVEFKLNNSSSNG